MGPTDRIKAAHRLLTGKVPFANVEESVIQDGRQVTIRIGHGCDERKLVPKGAGRSLLEEMAGAVEAKTHQRVDAMEQFLHTVLEEKIPEIVLDRVVDGKVVDLRDVFMDMMMQELNRVNKRLEKFKSQPFDCGTDEPNEEVDLHRIFYSFGQRFDVEVRFFHRKYEYATSPVYNTKSLHTPISNFADALKVFQVWPEVLEWVELMIRKLKAAAAAK